MPDYGSPPLDAVLTDLESERYQGIFESLWQDYPQRALVLPRPLPFKVRLSEHGTIIETEYPGSHRILPELHLAPPCTVCRSRTVYTDAAGSRCVKCGEPYRP